MEPSLRPSYLGSSSVRPCSYSQLPWPPRCILEAPKFEQLPLASVLHDYTSRHITRHDVECCAVMSCHITAHFKGLSSLGGHVVLSVMLRARGLAWTRNVGLSHGFGAPREASSYGTVSAFAIH